MLFAFFPLFVGCLATNRTFVSHRFVTMGKGARKTLFAFFGFGIFPLFVGCLATNRTALTNR